MSARNVMRRWVAALKDGEKLDLSSGLAILPNVDDEGAITVGDGTTDADVKVFLGSATEYALLDVGNSRVELAVPLLMSDGGTVTQITTLATGVTLNTTSGQITTVSSTLAAAGETAFTVTNSKVSTTSVVIAHLASTSSAGTPIVTVTAVAAGSFDVTVANLHASAALDNRMVINFVVIDGAAS